MTLEQQVHQNDVKLHKLIREVERMKAQKILKDKSNTTTGTYVVIVFALCTLFVFSVIDQVKINKLEKRIEKFTLTNQK